KTFNCRKSGVTVIPDLPKSLEALNCEGCHIRELPSLPDNLKVLFVGMCPITEIKNFPSKLRVFSCKNCHYLKELPNISSSIMFSDYENTKARSTKRRRIQSRL